MKTTSYEHQWSKSNSLNVDKNNILNFTLNYTKTVSELF